MAEGKETACDHPINPSPAQPFNEPKRQAFAVYRDFETPDRDDRAFYAALTPAKRIRIMIELLPPEHREKRLDRTFRITRRP